MISLCRLENTNRNIAGIVDFEKLENVEGVALANVLINADDIRQAPATEARQLQTRITFDDGARWSPLAAPAKDARGRDVGCDVSDSVSLLVKPSKQDRMSQLMPILLHQAKCSLNLHSVTSAHNYGRVFSSSAPGFVMGVGNIGDHLAPYEEGDTFLSTDAGLTWKMIDFGSNLYEFGDQGNLLVIADDQDATSKVQYSWDHGQTWSDFDFGVSVKVKTLTTIPDSTSLKFVLLGSTSKKNSGGGEGQYVIVQLDFATVGKRKCGDKDLEKWYARASHGEGNCLMGHKVRETPLPLLRS